MFPGGMLILVAYLELLLELYPGRIQARCTPHSLPAQLMRHFRIADRLGVSPTMSQPTHESVVKWNYLTGRVAEGTRIADLIDRYRKLTSADIPEGLYEAITEALTNVRQHAYPSDSDTPELLKRWWLFSKYEEPSGDQKGSLYIGVYDIGVGIQESMRRRLRPGEKLLDAAGDWLEWTGVDRGNYLERLLLEAAVERHRSSTGLSFRGNGLPEMRDFVLRTTSGQLSIVTGQAQYTCMATPPRSGAVNSQHLLGTLLVWTIPLEPKEKPE
jgi:hypothetical protein